MKISPDLGVKLVVPSRTSSLGANSRLVSYALNGLRRCWLPEHGRGVKFLKRNTGRVKHNHLGNVAKPKAGCPCSLSPLHVFR
jgi:hypothetical protein